MVIKKLINSILYVLPLAGFAQKAFTVNGTVGKLNAPAIAYLSHMEKDVMVEDSCMLKNGRFTFRGTVTEMSVARLYVLHQGGSVSTVRHPDFMSLMLDGASTITARDSLIHATLKGTQVSMDYIAVKKQKDVYSDRMTRLWNDYHALPADQRDDKAFGIAYNQAVTDDRLAKERIDRAYATEHPASLLSPMLLIWYANSMQLDTLEMIYNAFSAPVKASATAKVIAGKIYGRRAIEVGGLAPNFTIPDTANVPVSLADFRGKYVLVDFWASWCKPCRAENPNVRKAFDAYKDKNFTVLSVSIDDSSAKDKWLKAISVDRIGQWAQVCELKGRASSISNLYHLESIPQNVLVDPQGRIIAKNLRGEALQEKLAAILH